MLRNRRKCVIYKKQSMILYVCLVCIAHNNMFVIFVFFCLKVFNIHTKLLGQQSLRIPLKNCVGIVFQKALEIAFICFSFSGRIIFRARLIRVEAQCFSKSKRLVGKLFYLIKFFHFNIGTTFFIFLISDSVFRLCS